MDWYRTKNILIFVLLVLNITLFTVYYRTNTQQKIVNSQTKDNIVSILGNNNIKLDKSMIPDMPSDFTSHYIERAVTANLPFTIKLMGEGYAYDDEKNVYKTETKTLAVKKDTFEFSDTDPSEPPEEKTEKHLEDYCVKVMKKLDIDYKIYNLEGFNYHENSTKVIFTPAIGKYKFFDSYIAFEVTDKGVSAISGKNIILAKTASGISMKVFDINTVLLSLCSDAELNKSQVNKIASIKLGYYIGEIEEIYSNVLAIPAWQIALENGGIYYYDARNGKFLQ